MSLLSYKIRRSIFRWVQDEEGDIGLEIFGIVSFVKYKEGTIVHWFKKFNNAEKYQGARDH